MSGFYVNELLLKLLPRQDPHPRSTTPTTALLAGLHDAGERPGARRCASSRSACSRNSAGASTSRRMPAAASPSSRGRAYRYRMDGGAEAVDGVAEGALVFAGASLLSLAREELADPQQPRRRAPAAARRDRAVPRRPAAAHARGDARDARPRRTRHPEAETCSPIPCDSASTSTTWPRCARCAARSYPDPLLAALIAEQSGADSITLHLREDRRHIQDHDVERMRAGAADAHEPRDGRDRRDDRASRAASARRTAAWCRSGARSSPPRAGSTSPAQVGRLREACTALREAGIRVSLFVDPEPAQIEAALEAGAPVVELHTGAYAEADRRAPGAGALAPRSRRRASARASASRCTPGTASTTTTCSRWRPSPRSSSSTSATPSSRAPSWTAWPRPCAG